MAINLVLLEGKSDASCGNSSSIKLFTWELPFQCGASYCKRILLVQMIKGESGISGYKTK